MTTSVPGPSLVFLLDVDNTLLDNDRLKADVARKLDETIGTERAKRFWDLYEEVRTEEDYVDYPTTITRLSQELQDRALKQQLDSLLDDWPFKSYLYPHVMETIDHLETLGTAVILSDGDEVFQPLKIHRSGLWDAVKGHVLVYVHKEQQLKDVFSRYPAAHYVVVDDKPRILSALERDCPTEFTTILVLQGKYAHPDQFKPRPDCVVPHIGDLRTWTRGQFLAPGVEPP